MIFEVQGFLFGAKNGSQMGSESHLRRGSPQKASWKPLVALLEALGAEKTKLESLLAALGGLSRQFSAKTGPKMGPQKISWCALFTVPSRGPNLDPHFMGFQEDFRAFQQHVSRLSNTFLEIQMAGK